MLRLKHRADFLAAAASGVKVATPAFVLQARLRDSTKPRFGFTVSKKVGNAVVRNRVRRRLREVVRLADGPFADGGYDYVLIGRRAALAVPFDRLATDFGAARQRIRSGRRAPGARKDKR